MSRMKVTNKTRSTAIRAVAVKAVLPVLCLFMPLFTLPAADPPAAGKTDQAILFINTAPLGARISLDGKELSGRTPLLVRDVEAGTHSLATIKEGFSIQSIEFTLSPEEKKVIDIELPRLFFHQSFPGESTILLNRKDEASLNEIFRLEEGEYDVKRKDDRLDVGIRYPQQSLIDGLNLAIPVSLFLSGVVTAGEILFPSDVNRPISPIVVTSHAITLALIGVDAALHIRKNRYLRSRSFEMKKKRGPYSFAEHCELAERYLAEERMDEALDCFSKALNSGSESSLLPLTLYRVAKIHQIQGEFSMALSEYNLLVTEYPTAQLYDKAQKSLSDLHLIENRFEESLMHLESMVRMDPLYFDEELDLTRCEILERWYTADEARLEQVVNAYRDMVERYDGNENSPLYRYKLALYLFAGGDIDKSRNMLGQVGDLSENPILQKRTADLLEKIRQAADGKAFRRQAAGSRAEQ